MKKSIILSLGAAVMASAGFTSCDKFGGSSAIDNVDLIPVQISKEKWSFVNEDGKVMFENEFKNRPSLVYNGVFSVMEKEKINVYKVNGDKYEVLGDLEGLSAAGYMEDGLIPVCFPTQRIAVYDQSGKKKFDVNPVNGQEVVSVESGYSEGLLYFRTADDKEGYLDKEGKIAVKPVYSSCYSFSEGFAVVEKKNDNDEGEWSVINTKGETAFKLKDGHKPENFKVDHGYLIVRDDDRIVLYDTKGEITKLPTKYEEVTFTDGKHLIFREDGEWGVADMEGEVLIRPKYKALEPSNVDPITGKVPGKFDGYLAFDDDEVVLLDSGGKEETKFDCKFLLPMGKFGFFTNENDRWNQVDKEGKEICKEDFKNINPTSRTASFVVLSDYFDVTGIADTIAGLMGDNKVGDYTLGSTPASIFSGESPDHYSYTSETTLDGLASEGYRYSISGSGVFTEYMAMGSWNSYSYEYEYHWNYDSQLAMIGLKVDLQNEWPDNGNDEIITALKAKGFVLDKKGYVERDAVAALKKGNMGIFIVGGNREVNVVVLDLNISEAQTFYNSMLGHITDTKPAGNDTEVVEETVAEPYYGYNNYGYDSPAWDTVAVADEYYDW